MTVIIFYMVMRTRRCYIWILTIICLSCRQTVRFFSAFFELFDDYTSMTDFLFLYTWLIIRISSYSLDYNKALRNCYTTYQDISKVYSFTNYLGYVFYVPVMIHGPPLIYERYTNLLMPQKYDDFVKRSVDMICLLIRIACSGLLLELGRYFIYAQYVCENPYVRCHRRSYDFLMLRFKTYLTNDVHRSTNRLQIMLIDGH